LYSLLQYLCFSLFTPVIACHCERSAATQLSLRAIAKQSIVIANEVWQSSFIFIYGGDGSQHVTIARKAINPMTHNSPSRFDTTKFNTPIIIAVITISVNMGLPGPQKKLKKGGNSTIKY